MHHNAIIKADISTSIKKFLAYYRFRRFVRVLTGFRHWVLLRFLIFTLRSIKIHFNIIFLPSHISFPQG
jgi:hypothetical protein